MVIPTLVRQALRGQPMTVYGDGQQSRCFGHVIDVVRGLADLMECDAAKGQIVNLGNDEEISILALAERIRRLTGAASEIVLIPYEEAYGEGFDDMQRRVPDLARAKRLIEFRPTRGLDQILRDVIDFEKGR
jgi:UDP-glucose 4-epimerase